MDCEHLGAWDQFRTTIPWPGKLSETFGNFPGSKWGNFETFGFWAEPLGIFGQLWASVEQLLHFWETLGPLVAHFGELGWARAAPGAPAVAQFDVGTFGTFRVAFGNFWNLLGIFGKLLGSVQNNF